LLALSVAIISFVGDLLNWQAVHPSDGSIITVNNLLSADGFRWIWTNIVYNFVNFPPLGYVLAVMVGVGVAEGVACLMP
jgi:aminobenzoyl-glutamate transport protein